MHISKKPKVNIIKNYEKLERDWGDEQILAIIPKVLSLKRLFLKAGSKGGLQYHRKKNEAGILLSGELLIRYESSPGNLEEIIIEPGTSFHFEPGAIHQEEAITDCIIIEASTPHFNDRVRVEEKFGFKNEGGLPTTKINEILEK